MEIKNGWRMGNKIIVRRDMKSFILYQNEVKENYDSLRLYDRYDIRELANDAEKVQWLVKNNYYIEVNKEKCAPSIEYLTEEAKKRMMEEMKIFNLYNIFLHKDMTIDDIQLYYDFYLEIEINNIRLECDYSNAYVDVVYVSVPYKNLELKEKLTNLLGAPKVIPEQEHEQYGPFAGYYIVPISKIDKIIGIKKYRDKSKIGKCNSRVYINEEEIILDLKNFDMDIYKIFEKHGMLGMYDEEKVDPTHIYEK